VTGILTPDNRLFTLARQGGRPPSALAAIAVVFVILVVAIIPGQIIGRTVLFSHDGTPRFPREIQPLLEPIVQNVTIFLLIFVGLWGWLRISSKRPFWTLGWERKHAIPRTIRGMVIGGLMMTAIVGLSVFRGTSIGPGLLQTMGPASLGIRFLSLLSYFVQSPAEEVLFRGWLLGVTGARYRPWIGVIVSSAIFSLAHGLSHGITPLAFLNLFLFGVFAAFYSLAEGGLWGIGAWHAVWNWTQGDLWGAATDGSPHFGLLSSVQAQGPNTLTGGAFGPEGGLLCTMFFLIGIGIIAMRTRRSGESRPAATAWHQEHG
jgi:membrane protease YdiL (CAAX protease family)